MMLWPKRRRRRFEDVHWGATIMWCLFWGCAFALLFITMCSESSMGESPYAPGDTLQITVAALDSAGGAFLPDTATVQVYRLGTLVESLGYPGDLTQITGHKQLTGQYIIPDSWSATYDLRLVGKFTGDGFTNDALIVDPPRVRVNPNVIVDSLMAGAIGDLWAGIADGTAAIVDTTDCTPCGVYSGGQGVTGALVYIVRNSSGVFGNMTDVVGFTYSVDGYWRTRIPLVPGVDDTVYVFAYTAGRYQPSGQRLIVEE